jgi:hypothetical protein
MLMDYTGLTVYVAFDGDKIGRMVGRASLANQVDEVRRLSQAIDNANHIWASWALSTGGTVIQVAGDEGRLSVPASRLDELPALRTQYAEAVGATVSVGVGMELSEADKALMYAKIHGGDKVCFYTPDVDKEIEEVRSSHGDSARDEVDKLAEEYLVKGHKDSKNVGPHAGMQGASRPAAPQKPVAEASQSHSQGEAALAQAAEGPPPAERTHAASDFEEQLHGHAGSQQQKDAQAAASAPGQQAQDLDATKQKVVEVLQKVKAMAPVLQQVKQAAPPVYEALMDTINAMVMMAKQLVGQPVAKSEEEQDLFKTEDLQKMALIHDDEKSPKTVYRLMNKHGQGPYSGAALDSDEGGEAGGRRPSPATDFPPEDRKSLYPGSKPETQYNNLNFDLRFHFGFEKPEDALKWFGPKLMNKLHAEGQRLVPVPAIRAFRSGSGKQLAFMPHASMMTKDFLGEPKIDASKVKEHLIPDKKKGGFVTVPIDWHDAKKAELPMPHVPSRPHLDLPVGTSRDGKIKIRHGDGSSGWVQVRAGQVLSQDGHPISARNPGGK